ncbi:hypothetical protein CNR22_22960 [Sphingobacteriaceae bacterium]|nr:hypothetical protein CNR22_22960 [Sphingobacteriaceae bacterium]
MDADKPKIAGNKVLLIETNTDDIKLIGTFLQTNGYDVLVSRTHSQAKKMALTKSPDVILLGAESPLLAIDLFKDLRESVALSHIPVMFIFSVLKNEILDLLRVYTNIDFICKPVVTSELLFRLNSVTNLVLNEKGSNFSSKIKTVFELTEVKLEIQKQSTGKFPGSKKKSLAKSVVSPEPLMPAYSNDSDNLLLNEGGYKMTPKTVAAQSKGIVLVIEDNALNQAYIGSLVDEIGYQAIIAGTGKKALQQAKIHKVDLILLDVSLPDMSALEIVKSLNAQGNSAPLIIISGYSEDEIRRDNKLLVYDDYLLKPLSVEDFRRTVGKYVGVNFSVEESSKPNTSVNYDYSMALSITGDSSSQLQKWIQEFIVILENEASEFELLKKNLIESINPKSLHQLLNYGVYFGATVMKEAIWQLTDLNALSTPVDIKPTLQVIEVEVSCLLKFYKEELNRLKSYEEEPSEPDPKKGN